MPGMMVEDKLSGTTMTAASVPGLFGSEQIQYAPYYRTAAPTAKQTNQAMISLILGIVGLTAWCIPLAGLPVGLAGMIYGVKGLTTQGRNLAIAGLILSIICFLLSLANAILGAVIASSGFGR
jgi:hypothetical protein